MTVRINTNVAALRASRHLGDADRKLADSLRRLSSGFKINRAADDPAGLVVAEQLRGQVSGLNQAISNAELATTMVQTAEGSLTEVNNLLIRMRELALHAANEGANDPQAVEADQQEIDSALQAIGRIARSTRFGNRSLLDGSASVIGEAQGAGLTFLGATEDTRSSPVEGYAVEVTRPATRARMQGTTPLDADSLEDLRVTLFEGGKTAAVSAREGDTPRSFVGRLREEVNQLGLMLEVSLDEENLLTVRHREFGSAQAFQGASSTAGVLSQEAGVLQAADPGQDIQGTLGGEAASGRGQVLTGVPGSESTEGLSVRYTGSLEQAGVDADGRPFYAFQPTSGRVGTVSVANNAVAFQIGANPGQHVEVGMPLVDPRFLGRSVQTESGFANLGEINVRTLQGAEDSLRLIDSSIDELTLARGRLGAFHRNSLESNLATLRVTAENLMAAESTLRDTDMAQELTRLTQSRIQMDAAAAMLAHANVTQSRVVDLIKNGG